jgi:hypothetical protein
MIEPTIKLNGKLIAHGGDPYYINGLRKMGTDFIIEVSPNVRQGVSGKIASLANSLSSLAILKNDFLTTRKAYRKNVLGKKPDFEVHPSLNIFPLILPLSFTKKNLEYLINYGRIFTKAYL